MKVNELRYLKRNIKGGEHFVRKAFGNVERGGDSAGLAEADIYNSSHKTTSMNELKIGTGTQSLFIIQIIRNQKICVIQMIIKRWINF